MPFKERDIPYDLKNKGKLFLFDEAVKKSYLKKYIIGVDEAGRGPLAGPVVAGACVISKYEEWMCEIDDSKKLTPSRRDVLFGKMISSPSIRLGFGYCDNNEIDRLNILNASLLAMKRAVLKLLNYIQFDPSMALIMVDGNKKIKDFDMDQISVIKGDSKSLSIATASIFAKVLRDRWMSVIDLEIPQYDFKKHKGYPTKYHMEMIKRYGISHYHRKTFTPCKI